MILNDDLAALRRYLAEANYLHLDSIPFDTEAQADGFCAGLAYGHDDRLTPDLLPLRSYDTYDLPYLHLLLDT